MTRILPLAALLAAALLAPAALAAGSGPPPAAPGASDDSPKPSYRKAVKLVEAEKYEDAIKMLEVLLKDDPHNADILNYLGFSHRKLGHLAESEAYYKAALNADADHLGALEYEGELFLMQHRLAEAEANLARLATLCKSKCDEFKDLESAIADYKKQNG